VSFTVKENRDRVGIPRRGRAWFACLGSLGAVIDSNAQYGTAFDYVWMGWETRLQVGVEAVAVPLPLQRFPWTIAVGHRTMQQYHFPTIVTPEQPLVAGSLTFGTNVWLPEPPWAVGSRTAPTPSTCNKPLRKALGSMCLRKRAASSSCCSQG
jgi:hypothetical protein